MERRTAFGNRNRNGLVLALMIVFLGAIWLGWQDVRSRLASWGSGGWTFSPWPDLWFGDEFTFIRLGDERRREDGAVRKEKGPTAATLASRRPASTRSKRAVAEPSRSFSRNPGVLIAVVDHERLRMEWTADPHSPEPGPCAHDVTDAIESIARDRCVDLVLDSSFVNGAGTPWVFSGKRVVDLTNEVIARLRSRAMPATGAVP